MVGIKETQTVLGGENQTKRRVVFIGGLDDGRMALELLLSHPRVKIVGVFVLDEEAGQKVSGFRT